MNFSRRKYTGLLALACLQAAMPRSGYASEFQEMSWDQLIPKDWKPNKSLSRLASRIGMLGDDNPAVIKLMEKIREVWDSAPTIPELNGQKIRIAGYAVPLDTTPEVTKNMLLVPYFGACVHSPPPPANQIIYGQSTKPLRVEMMSPVWLSGTLKTASKSTEMGVSGYQLDIAKVEAYRD
jgi:hypothetical protein